MTRTDTPPLPALVEVRWPDGSVAYLTCEQYCALSTDVLRGRLVRMASDDERERGR